MSNDNFISECYIDTLVVKTILNEEPVHQEGIDNVLKTMNLEYYHDFAVGIIDNDKNVLAKIDNFALVCQYNNQFYIHKHIEYSQYVILISPAMEKFIIHNSNSAEINLSDYGFSSNLKHLRSITKHPSKWNQQVKENFVNLFNRLIQADNNGFSVLQKTISYLLNNTNKSSNDELYNITNS